MAGYGDDAGLAAYAATTGRTVSGTAAVLRQKGSVYLDGAYEMMWPGTPTGGVDQERAWPRTGAEDRYGNAIASNTVPQRVINASYEAALIEDASPGSLAIVTSEAERVKSLKAGSAQIEYADSSASVLAAARPVSTVIDGLLAPLLQPVLPGALVV